MSSQKRVQMFLAQALEVAPSLDACLAQLASGNLADAEEVFDRHGIKKGRGLLEGDHGEAIRFVQIGGRFGE